LARASGVVASMPILAMFLGHRGQLERRVDLSPHADEAAQFLETRQRVAQTHR
jgi:hypothetical protein